MNRAGYIDAARGFAIALVVLGHSVVVPEERGVRSPEVLVYVWEFFKPFRIPLLFFLSGILLPRSLQKSSGVYIRGKTKYILWPLLIWGALRYIPDSQSLSVFDWRVWFAPGYLWFLSFLFWYYMIALLCKRVPYLAITLLALICAFAFDGILGKFAFHAVFFFGGAWLIRKSGDLEFLRLLWVRFLVGLSALAAGVYSIMHPGENLPQAAIPAIFACILAVICAFQMLEKVSHLTVLRWVGKNSIVFYVSHMPIISITLTLLSLVGSASDPFVWILCAAAAMLSGVLLTQLRRKPIIRLLFEGPGNRAAVQIP